MIAKAIWVVVTLLLLSACGGGGGSSANPAPSPLQDDQRISDDNGSPQDDPPISDDDALPQNPGSPETGQIGPPVPNQRYPYAENFAFDVEYPGGQPYLSPARENGWLLGVLRPRVIGSVVSDVEEQGDRPQRVYIQGPTTIIDGT